MGDRRVTVRELAAAAGVSIGTVSRALKGQSGLSERTRDHILRVAEQLGYDTQHLRTVRPQRVLFVYNRSLSAFSTNHFYSKVLHGAEEACREADVSLCLASLWPGDDVPALIRRHQPDALLCAGYVAMETLAALRATGLPMVVTDYFQTGLRCINTDNVRGAQLATQHLLASGAQRPAMIIGPLVHRSVAQRVIGYRRALFEAGRLADPDLEVEIDLTIDYAAAAHQALDRLLALPQPPDAVFAFNDETAINAMQHAQARGLRVPEDLRFIGYDDIAAAVLATPPLSTVCMDKEALGRVAVEALIEGELEAGETILPVSLALRGSAPPLA